MFLSERKLRVLRAVIEDYVATASPVGSRTLTRKYGLGFSPATIRSEMADLEDLGYLEQPHISAGRIPSDKGYRLYVDALMQVQRLAEAESERIRRLYARRAVEVEAVVRETVHLLSESTNCLSLLLGPRLGSMSFRWARLLPVDGDVALLVLVSGGNLVEHRFLTFPPGISGEEAEAACSVLNERLRGKSLQEIASSLVTELRLELRRYQSLAEGALAMLRQSMGGEDEASRVLVGGTAEILNQPEFQDARRTRALLEALDRARLVRELLSQPLPRGQTSVAIGAELGRSEVSDCSLVTAPYCLGGREVGQIGVLGPKRMPYARIIAVVTEVAVALGAALSGAPGGRQGGAS